MKRLAAGALLAAAFAWGGSGFAANYFVDAVNGDDENDGLAETATAGGTWNYKDGDVGDEIAFSFAATADGGCADLLKTSSTGGLMLIIR